MYLNKKHGNILYNYKKQLIKYNISNMQICTSYFLYFNMIGMLFVRLYYYSFILTTDCNSRHHKGSKFHGLNAFLATLLFEYHHSERDVSSKCKNHLKTYVPTYSMRHNVWR